MNDAGFVLQVVSATGVVGVLGKIVYDWLATRRNGAPAHCPNHETLIAESVKSRVSIESNRQKIKDTEASFLAAVTRIEKRLEDFEKKLDNTLQGVFNRISYIERKVEVLNDRSLRNEQKADAG